MLVLYLHKVYNQKCPPELGLLGICSLVVIIQGQAAGHLLNFFGLCATCSVNPSIKQAWALFSSSWWYRILERLQAWAEGEALWAAEVDCATGHRPPPQAACLSALILFVLHTECPTSMPHWITGPSWLCSGGSFRTQFMESSSGFMVTWSPRVRYSIISRIQHSASSCYSKGVYFLCPRCIGLDSESQWPL